MTYSKPLFAILSAIALANCSGGEGGGADSPGVNEPLPQSDGAATRPSGEPRLVTVEGRIEQGVECPTLRTPDGDLWALTLGEADFGPGDYVKLTGEIADASICQQGKGTLIPQQIDSVEPPARDRDPARAGGVKLTESYLTGTWVAKGRNADCSNPDFSIRKSPGALVMEADIKNHDKNAAIALGSYPRLILDEPMPDLPMESRGPDGVAILRPATDAAYDPVTIGSATITGDGVVFVKCTDG